jgi:hypothetical protein
MPKYMIEGSYSAQGVQGVKAKGGSSRRDAVAAKTVVLLTPEEIDRAAERSVTYQPPGG